MRWTLSQTGPAAPEQVWRRYDDLAAWSQWAPFITGVEADGPRLAPGLTGTVIGVGGLRVRFVVLEVDQAGRWWTWRARLGIARLTLRHEVRPGPTGGTRALLDLTGALPVVLGYLLPAQLALRSLVRA